MMRQNGKVVNYNYAVKVKKELLDRFNNINEDDRYQLFGCKKEYELNTAFRENKISEESIEMILDWYEKNYTSPFWTGDILRDEEVEEDYVVTCIYTDGSIDLMSTSFPIERENTGTIGTNLVKVGSLELIVEPDITLNELIKALY